MYPGQPEKDIQKFKIFFEKDERCRRDSESNDLLHMCKISLNELMHDFKGKIFNQHNTVEELNFYKEIERQIKTVPVYDKTTCDQIFASYLIEFSSQTNRNYFLFMAKFVTLFRECINHYKKPEDPTLEATQTITADGVPDLCNEFITEFMESNDFFNLETGELIEIIQHFCNWLYESKYTTSRLTLLS